MLAPQRCVRTSDVTWRLALGGPFLEEVTLDLRVARSSPPLPLGAPGPRPTVLIITSCVASDSGLRRESLGMAPVDPLPRHFILFGFFPLFLPVPELDKLKKLSHEIRNPSKLGPLGCPEQS